MDNGFTVINTRYGTGGEGNPQTGDNIISYIITLVVSLIGLLTFLHLHTVRTYS